MLAERSAPAEQPSGCSSMDRRICASKEKRALEAKADRGVPPAAVRVDVLLHSAICLTPRVSK